MEHSKAKMEHFKCDFFKLYEYMSNIKYGVFFYGCMENYKLSFRELPSSDTFLHTDVNFRGAVVPFFLCILS